MISSVNDIDVIDYTKPAKLYSQTTQSLEEYQTIIETVRRRYDEKGNGHLFQSYDTICRRVANRAKQVQKICCSIR